MTNNQKYGMGMVLMCFSALMAVWTGVVAKDTGNLILWVFAGAFGLMIVLIFSYITNMEGAG